MVENNLILGLQKLANAEKSKTFIDDLRKQNKAKVWDLNPIKINLDGGIIKHNAEDIKKAVEVLETTLKTTLENTDRIDVVDGLSENLKVVTDWLKGTRLQVTEPFDKLKSSFTANERVLKDLAAVVKTKKDELLEETYKKARVKIFEELKKLVDELIEKSEIPINLNVFEDFAEVKKKLKSMIPNEKGKLGAASLKQIKEQFDMVANPLIEAKRVAAVKEKEHNVLTQQLSKMTVSGETQVLNETLESLRELYEQADMYYPNIKESAESQITSTANMIKANIKSNEKASQDAIQKQKDEETLKRFDDGSCGNENIGTLVNLLNELEPLIIEMVYFKDIANSQWLKLKSKIDKLQNTELEKIRQENTIEMGRDSNPSHIVDSEVGIVIQEDTQEQKTELKTFKLSETDINFLNDIKINAVNEVSAKEILISSLLSHLDMTELEEIK